jgi:hypothetical protein
MTTDRRVGITLHFATTDHAGVILAAVLKHLPPELIGILAGTNTYAFDPATYVVDEARVHVVLSHEGAPAGWYTDDEAGATERAKAIGGLLVELPVTEDHRAPIKAVTSG